MDVYSQRGSGFAAHRTLTKAVRAAFQRQSSGSAIDMMLETERDDYEKVTDLYRKSYDVRTWYWET